MSAPSLTVYVRGIGLVGPGLADWASGRALLADPAAWRPTPSVLVAPARLPPAERRRAGAIVKLSMAVADQACGGTDVDPRTLATVFSASTGDANNCHALCEALASPERVVSPTRFTNSVHNASAGYWHIATSSQAPSTSLCAFDASFGAGLIEALAQCCAGQRPVLLVTGDVPYPEPLHGVRPISDALGLALLLGHAAGDHDLARLTLRLGQAPASTCGHAGLDALRVAVPAGRGLPLLQALARREAKTVTLDYLDGLSLTVDLVPSALP
jgi:hypothetical protein